MKIVGARKNPWLWASWAGEMKAIEAMAPEFSIITICRNEARGIGPTCESVLKQKHGDFEWIVIDGASTDGTLEVIKQYRKRITTFISEPDEGIYDAMNKGIRLSRGKYIVFMNGGDRFSSPEVLGLVNATPEAELIYGQLELDEPGGELMKQPDQIDRDYLLHNMVHHQASFFHRSLFDRHGLYDTSYTIAGDYEFFCRILAEGQTKHHHLQEPFAVFDRTGISSSKGHRRLRKSENHRIRATYFPEYRHTPKAWRQRARDAFRFFHHTATALCSTVSGKTADNPPTKSVFFYTYHKCASTMMANHVLNALPELNHVNYDSLVYQGIIPADQPLEYEPTGRIYGPMRITKFSHMKKADGKSLSKARDPGFLRDKKAVFMVRDLRDIMVSAYFSFGKSHPLSKEERYREQLLAARHAMQEMSIDEYVLSEVDAMLNSHRMMQGLIEACPEAVVIRYEDMIDDFDTFIAKLTSALPLPGTVIRELRRRSRPRAEEDPNRHHRSGKTGDHKNKLQPETIAALNEQLAPALSYFGYLH